jgi:hypothetical protein
MNERIDFASYVYSHYNHDIDFCAFIRLVYIS